jgi:hypothetical protein
MMNLADGKVYVGSMLDRLLPLSFFNPHIAGVVRVLINGCFHSNGPTGNKHH